ncbi:hypothetical protein BH09ACT6_BH09ACT6_05650 [soil metagenome]
MSVLLNAGSPLREHRIGSVDPESMKRMAVVLRDPNLIHLDVAEVRRLGLGDRVINQGPTNCGYVLDMLRQAFPEGSIRSFSVRFIANVYGGDEVIAGGVVEGVIDATTERLYSCSVWLDVVGGGRALAGTASVAVPV